MTGEIVCQKILEMPFPVIMLQAVNIAVVPSQVVAYFPSFAVAYKTIGFCPADIVMGLYLLAVQFGGFKTGKLAAAYTLVNAFPLAHLCVGYTDNAYAK
jgi:hypothetical protein